MKKILGILGSFIAVTFLFTSCLDDDDEVIYSSNASILSFSINDIDTEVPSKTSSGEDTTIVVTVDGGLYTFSIDHRTGLIYNTDSLPLGTDITKVSVNLTTDGYYILYGDEGEAYSSSDSLDFTSPVKFTVFAYDGMSTKSYYARINVHRSYSDSLVWSKIPECEFPGMSINYQKALTLNDRVYVFAQNGRNISITYTDVKDGVDWTPLTPAQGIDKVANCSTVVVFSNKFYILAGETLYRSADGIQWEPFAEEHSFDRIVAATDEYLYVMRDGQIFSGTEVADDWEYIQTVDVDDFPLFPVFMNTPLATNPAIQRTVLVGIPEESTDSCAVVWSKLDIEKEWTYYNRTVDNLNGCPVLDNLAVLAYDGGFYAFGGRSRYHTETIEAFENIFVSRDNGITWWKTDNGLGLPEELLGYNGKFSYVVDKYNFIWLMCSGSNSVYKGRINRLANVSE